MKRLVRLLRPLAAMTLLGAGLVALPLASSAEAASNCSGSLVDSHKTDGGYGTWKLYWDSSTGKNCVRLDATGRGVGHTTHMYLSIQACSTKNSDSCGKAVVNQGRFHTYVGPVSVKAPHCVAFYYENALDYGSNTEDADFVGPFHCS